MQKIYCRVLVYTETIIIPKYKAEKKLRFKKEIE